MEPFFGKVLLVVCAKRKGVKCMDILRLDRVTKSFGAKKAVDGISFSVRQGEVLGLLGPNGAGKTTAIRMIMGIIAQDAGEIAFTFNGKSTSMDKEKIGYLPEERGLYYEAKVLDNLVYLGHLKGLSKAVAKKEALRWLDRLELLECSQQKLEKLSKGMQQKVQLIASLLHKPPLLMLDEPFSGLDPVNQEVIKDLIAEFRYAGTTVLLSAHQMNLVEELCDTIFMIHKGKQVLRGTLAEIKDQSLEHLVHVKYETGAVEDLEKIPGLTIQKQRPNFVSLSYEGTKSVTELLPMISYCVSIKELSFQKPPLHDIFIKTVQKRGEDLE